MWTALAGPGGLCAVFVKDGPLAWSGLLGFWIPASVFVVGMSVAAWCMWVHARHEDEAGPEKTADDLQLDTDCWTPWVTLAPSLISHGLVSARP